MRRSALKVLTGTLCATLALVGGLALSGCSGEKPEDAIRTDIASNFDAIKNLDDATIDELAEEMGSIGMEDYGIDTSELIASMADGFDYSIDFRLGRGRHRHGNRHRYLKVDERAHGPGL